ncbi:MAG: transporter [Bacteroidales bacterium]|nr:transporter [Bacteroidales bacterium]
MFQKVKDFMMPIAMLLGGIFYSFFNMFTDLMPYLIFLMLLFTFSKLSPRSISVKKLHFILLALQLGLATAAYFLILPYSKILAEGAMICFLAPTATSAAVITGMLKGDMGFLTVFTLISNVGVAIAAPILFSMSGMNPDLTFLDSMLRIFIKVFPLLILPLLCAWAIRLTLPKVQQVMLRFSKMPFYLWSLSLMIVTARTVSSLVNLEKHDVKMELTLAFSALFICCLQFVIGKTIGSKFNNRIASGQSLGQKNTILAIWMTQVFLNPVASLAPATYVVWQNIINSYQLWKAQKN